MAPGNRLVVCVKKGNFDSYVVNYSVIFPKWICVNGVYPPTAIQPAKVLHDQTNPNTDLKKAFPIHQFPACAMFFYLAARPQDAQL